jgi:hypothetical protein
LAQMTCIYMLMKIIYDLLIIINLKITEQRNLLNNIQ